MASIAISASSLPRSCTSNHVSKKKQHAHQARPAYSSMTKNPTPELTIIDVGDRDGIGAAERHRNVASGRDELEKDTDDVWNHGERFTDERWKNGTWDLNMFVKNGKMDWEGVIVAGELLDNSIKKYIKRLIFIVTYQLQV